MFRATTVRLATHTRTPMISFPVRDTTHPHPRVPHPCAPASVISSSAFLSSLKDNPTDTPLLGSAGGQAAGKGFDSSLPRAQYDETSLPAWLRRSKYSPSEAEIEAVESGGASVAPIVTKASKQQWYTAQV